MVVIIGYIENGFILKPYFGLGFNKTLSGIVKMNDINGLADIIIGKQRHGPTGNIQVEFEGMYTKFKDLAKN